MSLRSFIPPYTHLDLAPIPRPTRFRIIWSTPLCLPLHRWLVALVLRHPRRCLHFWMVPRDSESLRSHDSPRLPQRRPLVVSPTPCPHPLTFAKNYLPSLPATTSMAKTQPNPTTPTQATPPASLASTLSLEHTSTRTHSQPPQSSSAPSLLYTPPPAFASVISSLGIVKGIEGWPLCGFIAPGW